ncbi:MAG: mechanosensitive ion channel family protein [Flavobacteriales bacterium]|jgi:miniconductance mechanosensitive channel|nr:mechanosensitive ion channel family protein [Flavobacteriales bacterium]
MKEIILQKLKDWNFNFLNENLVLTLIHLLILVIVCYALYWVTKTIILNKVHDIAEKTKTKWDDLLVQESFFKKLSGLIPITIVLYSVNSILEFYEDYIPFTYAIVEVFLAIAILRLVISFLNALHKFLETNDRYKDKPIQSYIQLTKIVVYIFFGIIVFSLVTGKTPMFFLTAMGAMSAILLLIFKDTILGFIGSIQLATNDMVRIGDWISMPKYGADGTVIEINLATIKVRNFDLTITTIPTYSMISDSFKNWRGMEESAGRRIKRALNIKISSVNFCDEALIADLKNIALIKPYIEEKQAEIESYNKANNLDNSLKPNGRSLTNVGVFRKYVELYLKSNESLNTDLTCMVRQLSPTEKGLPIEIYAFSKNKEWVIYEAIVADIFDHLLAVVPAFELEVFQSPTGSDFTKVAL